MDPRFREDDGLATVILAHAGIHGTFGAWQRPTLMEKLSYVYILASAPYGTLYIGVTTDLIRRVWQHRQELAPGFTQEHAVKNLVWYEQHTSIHNAIAREKHLKKWRREWKIELIHLSNPLWHDLYPTITA